MDQRRLRTLGGAGSPINRGSCAFKKILRLERVMKGVRPLDVTQTRIVNGVKQWCHPTKGWRNA